MRQEHELTQPGGHGHGCHPKPSAKPRPSSLFDRWTCHSTIAAELSRPTRHSFVDSDSHLGLNHLKVFSNKLIILGCLLLAEITSSSAWSLLSLCVHTDGTAHYELSLDQCCNRNDQGQGECGSFEEAHPDQADGFTPEDGCEDYSVFFSQVPVTPPTTEGILLGGPERSDLM